MLNVIRIMNTGILTPSIENFNFIESLKVMLRGMLSIFIVTGILILLVVILNKYSKKKKEKDEKGA